MTTETTSPQAPTAPKRSAVEGIKESSRQLRGTIREELLHDTDHFAEQNKQLLKFHGTYQQEDRDARKARKKDGVGKHYMFMVRCKIPGGRLTAAQYLAVDQLAEAHGNGTLRFTTRQGIQLHGVLKSHLHDTIAGINHCLLSTLGACGDVERNVMACPAPHAHDGVHAQLQETAALLAAHLAPRSRAYHEIWLNGQLQAPSDQSAISNLKSEIPVEEPLYGKTYLPRKFKTGLALPEDNCIDVHAQDLGLLAIVEGGTIVGYNVLAGGGMGMTHGNASTFPHLARPICYVPATAVVQAAEAMVRLFRDHGNRADRKRARLKYLVHDWGVERFRAVYAGYLGGTPELPRPVAVSGYDPHLGWNAQGDGKWYYGLSIENGRVKDEGPLRLRTGLRTIMERFVPSVRLTPLQDILLCDLDEGVRPDLEKVLAEHGILRPDQLSTVQKFSMACPAVPTCGLAITESERSLPALIDRLEPELARLGLQHEPISIRMTGCPNGCARPYQSDIGLVGRSGDKFTIFVGGRILGDRLSFVLRDLVPQAEIVPTLLPLLEDYARKRQAGEGFGDYCQRLGAGALQALLPAAGKPAAEHAGAPAAANGNGSAEEHILAFRPRETNGHAGPHAPLEATNGATGAAETRKVALVLADPEVTLPVQTDGASTLRSETFLAGPPGEELPDYTIHYNSDGSVHQTVIYFYGDDLRAAGAHTGIPLRREAAYFARVHPFRLHAARKLSDTYHVGPAGRERPDRRVEYHADGQAAQTVILLYEGDLRATAAPSGAAVRRRLAVAGSIG